MTKKRQHYVQRDYLNSWADHDQIFCMREDSIFKTNTTNVGCQTYFYKLNELTADDIQMIYTMVVEKSPPPLREIHSGTLLIFSFVHDFLKLNSAILEKHPELRTIAEQMIYETEEELHCAIENNANQCINLARSGDISFYDSDDESMKFLNFLCVQYLRTKKIRESVYASVGPTNKIRINVTWNALSHIFATNFAFALYNSRNEFNMVLLNNSSSIPFITSDQPVLNTFSFEFKPSSPTTDLELYYPISPSKAILLTKEIEYQSGDFFEIDSQAVQTYNQIVLDCSFEQVFSNKKELLEEIIAKKGL